jgi:hypothetical protein
VARTSSSEPAASELQRLLALSDDELLEVLGSTPLDVMTGEEDEREDLCVLVQVTREAGDPAVLARWVRSSGPEGRPIDALLARDFAGYERALAALAERGFVLRGGG